jgi:hypothetical protein
MAVEMLTDAEMSPKREQEPAQTAHVIGLNRARAAQFERAFSLVSFSSEVTS